MTERLDVMLESECSAADLTAITKVFEAAGIPADVSAAYARRSADLLPWVILIGGGYVSISRSPPAVIG